MVLVGCGTQQNDDSTTVASWENAAQNSQETWSDLDPVILASCLADKWFTMYGTERCPHCKDQKKAFGDAFDKITYVDCDEQKNICLEKWVNSFPRWRDADENEFIGRKSLAELAKISGCEQELATA